MVERQVQNMRASVKRAEPYIVLVIGIQYREIFKILIFV